jgi:hypothetical protein
MHIIIILSFLCILSALIVLLFSQTPTKWEHKPIYSKPGSLARLLEIVDKEYLTRELIQSFFVEKIRLKKGIPTREEIPELVKDQKIVDFLLGKKKIRKKEELISLLRRMEEWENEHPGDILYMQKDG